MKPHYYNFLALSTYVGRGISCKAIRKPEYAFEEMIPTCINIQKFCMRMLFNFLNIGFHPISIIQHENIMHIPSCAAISNILKNGTRFRPY